VPSGGLSGAATFTLTLDHGTPLDVTVPAVHAGIDGAVTDLNQALHDAFQAANRPQIVQAGRVGNRVTLFRTDTGAGVQSIVLTNPNRVTRDELAFANNQANADNKQLLFDYDGRPLLANWVDSAGNLLVQQVRIEGVSGDDDIEFLDSTQVQAEGNVPYVQGLLAARGDFGLQPVDVSPLTARSNDWVGVIDGGPGDDTLKGTNGRDRLDGGPGSDVVYGMAGDDQLWGDG